MYPGLPLIQAINDSGNLEKIMALEKEGATINYNESHRGISALQFAIYNISNYSEKYHPTNAKDEKLKVVKYLIEKGADFQTEDGMGRTGVSGILAEGYSDQDYFTQSEKMTLLKLMFSKGLRVNKKWRMSGNNMLHYIANNDVKRKRYSKIGTLLIKKGIKLDSKNAKGESPRMIYTEYAEPEIVSKFKADVKKYK
jgi:ankyrin repeat protein